MQAALAIVAGLLCTLAGFRHAGFLHCEAKRLNHWYNTLERLKLLLTEGGCSLPEALRSAASSDSEADQLLHLIAEEMQNQPLKTASEVFRVHAVCCTEYDVLL